MKEKKTCRPKSAPDRSSLTQMLAGLKKNKDAATVGKANSIKVKSALLYCLYQAALYLILYSTTSR